MMHKQAVRAGVIGGRGYAGREVVRLVRGHPGMTLAFATSSSEAGTRVPETAASYMAPADAPLGEVDVVFTCLGHGRSGEWAMRARCAGAAVVDLSADLRDGREGAAYGLPELWREEIRGARLVANPGCYPTGVLIALAPAVRADLVDAARPVVVNASSGVTGAGRTPRPELLFGEVSEEYRAYGVGNRHRHVMEMVRALERCGGAAPPPLVFTPHLLPVRRGILETICVPLAAPLTTADAVSLWGDAYADEPCVEVVVGNGSGSTDALPTLRSVVGRSVVSLGFSTVDDVEPPVLLVIAALDNLLKGAAGQAVQNANLMTGFDEWTGLER